METLAEEVGTAPRRGQLLTVVSKATITLVGSYRDNTTTEAKLATRWGFINEEVIEERRGTIWFEL